MADGGEAADHSSHQEEDVGLAIKGINLMLNNDWVGAAQLFKEHQETSPILHFCHSFLTFLQALMSVEEEELAEAQVLLEGTQKLCESSKSFGQKRKDLTQAEQLQRKIIIADTYIFESILAFANQEISGYLKGGWYLRKAWKLYSKRFKTIKDMYDGKQVDLEDEDDDCESSTGLSSQNNSNVGLPHEVVSRLLGSVSFGFGILHLCLAMLPPKVLKIVQFLGFEGSKQQGIWCLEYTSTSKDYKAPLASFALIWYHTVIRPFFALDGAQVDAGVQDAMVVMKRIETQYEKSALFNWFRGRVLRLQSKIDEALSAYQYALEMSGDVREIKLTCLYEIGYCNMMKLQWQEASACWARLKEQSRWSKSYYAYTTAVCQGALGDLKAAHQSFKDCLALQDKKRKDNQIEAFALRRAKLFQKAPPTPEHATLLCMEILYLWHALPQCTEENQNKMVAECGKVRDKKLFHLSSLIEGVLHRELKNEEMAITCLKEAIARHQGMKEDGHVAAYAMYELGDLYSEKIGGFDESTKYYHQAKDMKDYDFENRLNIRIHAALKKSKEQGTAV